MARVRYDDSALKKGVAHAVSVITVIPRLVRSNASSWQCCHRSIARAVGKLTSQQTSCRLCPVPDREETMFIKNTWYVAGWSKEVPQDGFLARTILGLPLALWRDQAGKVVAFEDMCCHRGAPLVARPARGRHACAASITACCSTAPASASRSRRRTPVPANACVRTFPVVERHRWIWIWMGDAAQGRSRARSPTRTGSTIRAGAASTGYTHYDTNYLLICDNLLDLAHLPTSIPRRSAARRTTRATRPPSRRRSAA